MMFNPGRPAPCRLADSIFVTLTAVTAECNCYNGTYELTFDPEISVSPTTFPGWVWSGTLCGVPTRLIIVHARDCLNTADQWTLLLECDSGSGPFSVSSGSPACDPTASGQWDGAGIHDGFLPMNATCCFSGSSAGVDFDVAY